MGTLLAMMLPSIIISLMLLLVVTTATNPCDIACQGAGDGSLVSAGCCEGYCMCSGGSGMEIACRGPTGFCSAAHSCIPLEECRQGEGCCSGTPPCPPPTPSYGCSGFSFPSSDDDSAVCFYRNKAPVSSNAPRLPSGTTCRFKSAGYEVDDTSTIQIQMYCDHNIWVV